MSSPPSSLDEPSTPRRTRRNTGGETPRSVQGSASSRVLTPRAGPSRPSGSQTPRRGSRTPRHGSQTPRHGSQTPGKLINIYSMIQESLR